MKQNLKQPQIIVITDLDDLFIPVPDELLININEAKDLLLNLLDTLPNIYAKTSDNGSCLNKALLASLKIFKHVGGKLIIMQASDKIIFDEVKKNNINYIEYY